MTIRLIGKFCLLVILLFSNSIYSEVILDGSLGPNIHLQGPQFNIDASLGQLHGSNLFHSFQQFNINDGEIATFSGPDTVNNIIGRITGGTSFINGTLNSTIPQANLYLLNSKGFLLGENAKLDLQGSFYLTTANKLYLSDNEVFTAQLGQTNILTSSPPSAFGFLDSGTITIQKSGLVVNKDKTLSISANEINLDGGRLRATSGHINLAAITNDNLKIPPKTFNIHSTKGKITLKNNATVDVGKQGTGDIYINGGQLFISESTIVTNTEAGTNSGIININVNSLLLDEEANIESRAFNIDQKGNNIVLNVAETTTLMQASKIRTSSLSRKAQAGNSGNIILNTKLLNLYDNSLISTTTYGPGLGGNINITAIEDININNAVIQASSKPSKSDSNAGNAGQIVIKSRNLNMFNSGKIDSNTFGKGQGGNVILNISYMLNINDALISADSLEASGNAGDIRLKTAILEMNNGTISTATDRARGGNITINAQTLLNLKNSKLTAKVNGGFGNGGNIAIANPRFFHMQNSYIKADASGGNGGMIFIVTGTPKDIYNSEITASSETGIDGGVEIDGIYNVEVTTLPIDFLDASTLIKYNCAANSDTEYSSFFIKGRGGLPNAPDDLQGYISP
ncbi:filamentous hemagglutinin N-terminal domain-containing protein [Candidatus Halobeggiatoa sp. HSG11]|nr:filamentous hemagglutinin N-terminal domain-containing protein [Candidatus Halobeggiatoa sp. HSG11]